MKSAQRFLLFGLAAIASLGTVGFKQTARMTLPNEVSEDGSLFLPNGQRLHGMGTPIALPGDLPLKIEVEGDHLNVLTGGYHHHGLFVVSPSENKVVEEHKFTVATGGITHFKDQIWVGRGETVGAVEGDVSTVAKHKKDKKAKSHWYTDTMKIGDQLWAVDTQNDTLECISEEKAVIALPHRPYAAALKPDSANLGFGSGQALLAVVSPGANSVTLFKAGGGLQAETKKVIKVGSQPMAIAWGPNGALYVANSGSDTVSVIKDGAVVTTVRTAIEGKELGHTPNALAVSPDLKKLFVANADANNILVLDIGDPIHPNSLGFIPTGWYPTCLAVSADSKTLYIGCAKGMSSRNNKEIRSTVPSTSYDKKFHYEYIGNTLSGYVVSVPIPEGDALKKASQQALANAHRTGIFLPNEHQLATAKKSWKNIHHVLYIIRENRTYDQVFGDMDDTMADPSLTMYGESVTPNAHAIAKTWTTYENLYCDGEVSQDGHQWCDGAYTTNFNQRVWPANYAGKGMPDEDDAVQSNASGYLWDSCAKMGLSYRTYGEASSFSSNPAVAPEIHGYHGLAGHVSEAWDKADRDTDKAKVFIQELQAAEKSGKWNNFMIMSLGEDHTKGLSPGEHTPFACVANNDQALGMIVEAVTHSKFWKDTAIFVMEDDAQNGCDHIDAHRTVGLVISPYTSRKVVDSTFYCTGSMVASIETILGLPPLTAHDKHATLMAATVEAKPNFAPFTRIPAKIDVNATNPKTGKKAALSASLDFSAYDRANPEILNQILWEDAHPDRPMPKPVNSVWASAR